MSSSPLKFFLQCQDGLAVTPRKVVVLSLRGFANPCLRAANAVPELGLRHSAREDFSNDLFPVHVVSPVNGESIAFAILLVNAFAILRRTTIAIWKR